MAYWILDVSGEKTEISWEQISMIEKDLCYLLHHIVDDYQNLGGTWEWDWYSEDIFPLKYWNFLGIQGYETMHQQEFIDNGCLLWILGLSMEQIEDFGRSLDEYGNEIAKRLSLFHPEHESTARLFHIVQYFFNVARNLPERTGIDRPCDHVHLELAPDMVQELDWVFTTIVKGYYQRMLEIAKFPRISW